MPYSDENKWESMFTHAPLPYQSLDCDGNFLDFNSAFMSVLGYKKNELIGKNFAELLHPDWVEHFKENFPRFKAVGEILGVEFEMIKKDGSSILVHFHGKIQHNELGEFERTHCIFQDVSSQRAAEIALRRSEERFAQINKVLLELGTDYKKNIHNLTALAGQMLGGTCALYNRLEGDLLCSVGQWKTPVDYDPCDFPEGHICYDVIYQQKDDVLVIEDLPRSIYAQTDPNVNKYNLQTYVGRCVFCSDDPVGSLCVVFQSPLAPSDNDKRFLSTIAAAISREEGRHQAERAVQASNELISSILRSAPVGIGLVDRDRTIVEVNDRLCAMTGYTKEELLHQHASVFYPSGDEFERVGNIKYEQLHGEGYGNVEAIWQRKDTSLIHVRLTSTLLDPQNPSRGVTFSALDISGEKLAKEEQAKLQAQLAQSNKMESLGRLAGGIAHDFNNVLHVISGNLEMMALRSNSQQAVGLNRIQTIQKSIDRASQLVQQMLLFSRKAESYKQSVDLNEEVEQTLHILERSVPKMISIETFLPDGLPPISADPVQVEQVLLNLGSNAEAAMPAGGRFIVETSDIFLDHDFVRMHTEAKEGRYICLSVSDTGHGMDDKTLNHVFDPFFTTKEIGKGTGLGLASVYGIVRAHDGFIRCYSEPGKGTTFHIYWPVVSTQKDGAKQKGQMSHQDLESGEETILIVDDEKDILELTAEALEIQGYTVYMAENGEQALAMYSKYEESIDLVILDLNMPGMGGASCLRQLKKLQPSIKVILASGYSAHGQAQEIADRASAFIGKPYHLRELLTTIRRVLGV